MWYGKLVGFILGSMFLGPIGGIIGFIIGHKLDVTTSDNIYRFSHSAIKQTQRTFFNVTFAVMGHIAKSDGVVSEEEIKTARQIMDRMNLNEAQIQQAINYFQQGKSPQFDLNKAIDSLIQDCHRQRSLLQMFLEIQFHAAKADRKISPHKRAILQMLCQRLGFAPVFSWEYANIFGEEGRSQSSGYYRKSSSSSSTTAALSLEEAYHILNTTSKASNAEIKKAYRKMMSQNHPDKLIARGLPEEMIKLANSKTQKIKSAYELIRKERNF